MFMAMDTEDLYVDIKVVTPTKLTDRQKELMKEFAQLNGEEINEQPSNFKDRAKRFFKENKSMNWTELSIIINHEAVELATNILENHGSNGVVIEDSDDLINQPEDKYGEIYALKKRIIQIRE